MCIVVEVNEYPERIAKRRKEGRNEEGRNEEGRKEGREGGREDVCGEGDSFVP